MAGRFTVETVFKGTDNTSGVIASIQARTKAMSHGLAGPVGFADKGIDGFKKLGAVAAVAGVAAGFAFSHLVEAGMAFEQSITNVGAVMGKSRGQIADLEKAALSLGVTTQFSATEVSEAMEQMARKGFDSEEILHGIPGVLDAIAASGEGMVEVSQVVGSSIRGFGLDAADASHVADVLAYSAEKTGAKITDMGSALATAAPTARALGVSIEDAAASVGLLQKMGIDASTAGSATATMLAKISHPSHEAAQKMKAMGISFKDAKGNMLPFRDVLGQFVKAGDKAGGNMDRMSFFAELVGLRGDKAALALSDMAKSGDFDKLSEGLKNVDGYARKVAELKLGTTANRWKLLNSTIEVLETKLWNLNSGPIKGVIDKINAWVTANQDLIVSGAQEYVGKIVAKVSDLSTKIDKGVSLLGNFKDGFKEAFGDSKVVKIFGAAIQSLFGGEGDKDPAARAKELGKSIGDWTFRLIGFIGVVKTAQFGIGALNGVMTVAKAGKWLWDVGSAASSAVRAFTALQQVGPASIVSMGNAISGVGGGFNSAANGASKFAGYRGMLNETFSSWESKAGLAAAAIASIGLAYKQVSSLFDESGGWEGIKGMLGAGPDPTQWGFEGMDAAMNAKAKRDAEWGYGMTDEDKVARARKRQLDPAKSAAAAAALGMPGQAPGGFAGDFGLTPAAPRPPGPYADGYVPPAPQISSGRDEAAKTNAALNDSIKQIVPQLSAATKGLIKIQVSGAAKVDASGAPGVNVTQSGSF